MGTVELLTREGEIAIAKRIEEGLSQVQAALGQFPVSVESLLTDYEAHKEGKKRLAEVIVGFNDLADEMPTPKATRTRTMMSRVARKKPHRPVRIRRKSLRACRR